MSTFVTRARLAELLESALDQRILVVGDAMLDVYLTGEVERISPEAPVPVVRVAERRYSLGGASNVAQNVAAIGSSCTLVAAIGNDASGLMLRRMLDAIGVATSQMITTERMTTQKTRILARSQQLVRVDEEDVSDLAADVRQQVRHAIIESIGSADALVLEDYNKGLLTPDVIESAIRIAKDRNIPVVVDPKYRNFFSYAGATVFKPNVRELEAALGAQIDVEHPDTLPAMLERLQVEHILLTLGERGMVLFSGGEAPARIPTAAREVFDVVGAGDTVTAYLAAMLAAGASPLEAATVANVAAGIEVSKRGAATVAPHELLDHFETDATH